MCVTSKLRLLTIKLLRDEPATGYDIAERIEDTTGWKPSYGSIYPLLERLEDEGNIAGKEQGDKTVYRLTEKGKKSLDIQEQRRQLFEEMEENAKVLGVLMDEDMTPVVEMLRQLQTGDDPLEPVRDEIVEFRNALIELALNGNIEPLEDDIKELLEQGKRMVTP